MPTGYPGGVWFTTPVGYRRGTETRRGSLTDRRSGLASPTVVGAHHPPTRHGVVPEVVGTSRGRCTPRCVVGRLGDRSRRRRRRRVDVVGVPLRRPCGLLARASRSVRCLHT